MGWNSIQIVKESLLFDNIKNNEYYYFCHSYFFDCNKRENVIAETAFSNNFSSVINKNNIYGIQFHPEKSHDNGIKILNNFANL